MKTSKYNDTEKLRIIGEAHLTSFAEAAERYQISPVTIYAWRQRYYPHLTQIHKHFTDDEKRQIMIEAELTSAIETARRHGIHPVTISNWRQLYDPHALARK